MTEHSNTSQSKPVALWSNRIRAELEGNILPFWMTHSVDHEEGGFYGKIRADLTIEKEAPRSVVLNTRLLWTFAAATRLLGARYRETADWAFHYVVDKFVDRQHGGLFWMLDRSGSVLSDRKQIYGQAFGIYAFAEYHRATGNGESLALARQLFEMIERHSWDTNFGGYIEARARDWRALEDFRLSEKDLNCPKSMNTHLHIMEAYTNLLRVSKDAGVAERLEALLRLVLDRIVDLTTGHLKLFFDDGWSSLSHDVSFGHDIEASWLIVEAAELLGDSTLLRRTREAALCLAQAVYTQGLDKDGSLYNEANGSGALTDRTKHWWVQAETVVGFYNAFQLSGNAQYLHASQRTWDFIQERQVDKVHGEWHAKLSPNSIPLLATEDGDVCLAGPWKCPYHNARACFEMLDRLA